MEQLSVRIERLLLRQFEVTAAARGLSRQGAAAEALQDWISEHMTRAVEAVTGAGPDANSDRESE